MAVVGGRVAAQQQLVSKVHCNISLRVCLLSTVQCIKLALCLLHQPAKLDKFLR
jgi:hypothetical protein